MRNDKYKKIFGIGPLGALISLGLILPFWWLDKKLGHPLISQNPALLRMFGCLLIITGAGIHLWAGWTLRNWWRDSQLCTIGPFEYFRHPMYAAWITFIASGISLCFNSWIFLLWPIAIQPIWHRLVIKEEIMIAEIFSDEYRKYANRTGRFFPRLFKTIRSFSDN